MSLQEHKQNRAMSTISGHQMSASTQSVAHLGSHRASNRKGSHLNATSLSVSQRSKSLLRADGRQTQFKDHIEKFNQFDPLLHG